MTIVLTSRPGERVQGGVCRLPLGRRLVDAAPLLVEPPPTQLLKRRLSRKPVQLGLDGRRQLPFGPGHDLGEPGLILLLEDDPPRQLGTNLLARLARLKLYNRPGPAHPQHCPLALLV